MATLRWRSNKGSALRFDPPSFTLACRQDRTMAFKIWCAFKSSSQSPPQISLTNINLAGGKPLWQPFTLRFGVLFFIRPPAFIASWLPSTVLFKAPFLPPAHLFISPPHCRLINLSRSCHISPSCIYPLSGQDAEHSVLAVASGGEYTVAHEHRCNFQLRFQEREEDARLDMCAPSIINSLSGT